MTAILINRFVQDSIKKQNELKAELGSFHYSHISDKDFFEMLKVKAKEYSLQRG